MSGPDLSNCWVCACGSTNSNFWGFCRHCQAEAPDLGGEVKVAVHGGVAPELIEKLSMPVEEREAFDQALDEWPFDDDPPDPL